MRIRRPSPKVLRRGLTGLAIVTALAGLALLAYPFATDLWAGRIQHGLDDDLARNAARYRAGQVRTGEALTRLEIPQLDIDIVVVEGTTLAALRAGAGHYPATALPGEAGNVAIAGHRTTYGRPFNRIDELVSGDQVILTTPIGRHVYEVVARPRIVSPADWSPIQEFPRKGSWLTLTSCHPEGSADFRIVARAELVRSAGDLASGSEAGE